MKLCISTRLFNIYSARLKISLFTEININKRDYSTKTQLTMSFLTHLEYNLLTSNLKAPGFTSGRELVAQNL